MLSPPVSVRSRVLPCDLTGERASRGRIQPPPAPSSAAVAARRSRDTVPSSSSPVVSVCDVAVFLGRFAQPDAAASWGRGGKRMMMSSLTVVPYLFERRRASLLLLLHHSPSHTFTCQQQEDCGDLLNYCTSVQILSSALNLTEYFHFRILALLLHYNLEGVLSLCYIYLTT